MDTGWISKLQRVGGGRSGLSAVLQSLVVKLLVVAINTATGIITARMLRPDGRGELAAMILWPVFLANALTLGVPSSLVYNLRREPE
ncbi:MAG TPA: polysaccharide biosynthesis protein, partial [Blastocatellia bacterium]